MISQGIYGGSREDGYLFIATADEEALKKRAALYGELLKDYQEAFRSSKKFLQATGQNIISALVGSRIALYVDDGEEAYTDGNTIVVGTKLLQTKGKYTNKSWMIFIGVVLHEVCHCIFTKFEDIPKDDSKKGKILHSLHNVIEDSWIEPALVADRPGLHVFLKEMKHVVYQMHAVENKMDAVNAAQYFLNYVRYPGSLTDENNEFFKELRADLDGVLLPAPTSTREARVIAEKVYDILMKYIPEEEMQEADSKEEMRAGAGNPMPGKGSVLDKIADRLHAKEISPGEDVSTKINAAIKDDTKGSPDVGRSDTILDCVALEAPKKNKTEYDKTAAKYRSVSDAISRRLEILSQKQVRFERNVRSGRFDSGRFINGVVQEDTNFYKKTYISKEPDVDIVILIDSSGSMGGNLGGGTKIEAAKDASICLVEAMRKIDKVGLKIYSHTTAGQLSAVTVLYEKHEDRFGIGGLTADSGNADGDAIRFCHGQFDKNTNTKVFIILSDGEPTEVTKTAYNSDPVENTRIAIDKMKQDGIKVIPIIISSSLGSYVKKIYGKDYYVFTNMDAFGVDLPKFVQNIVESQWRQQ